VPQSVAPCRPETRHGPADDGVTGRVRVDEARVGDLAAGGGVDAVDFGVGEGFEILVGEKDGYINIIEGFGKG